MTGSAWTQATLTALSIARGYARDMGKVYARSTRSSPPGSSGSTCSSSRRRRSPTDGHVNVSPKGDLRWFRILGPREVGVSRLRRQRRGDDRARAGERPHRRDVLRVRRAAADRAAARPRVGTLPEPDSTSSLARFDPPEHAVRSVIRVEVERIADSCGYGVPLMRFEGKRTQYEQWVDKKVRDGGFDAYVAEKNAESIDGLAGSSVAAVAIRAFLFDFDGLILDTETASRAGWEWLYREHGHELPPEKWALMVGTIGGWDPMGAPRGARRRAARARGAERAALRARASLIEAEELRPGIADYLEAARAARPEARDRLELVAPLDRHAPRAARARRSAGTRSSLPTATRSARSRAPTLYLEALERARRRAPTRRSCSRTRRTASRAAKRRGHLRRRDPEQRSRATSGSTDGGPRRRLARRPAARRAARALQLTSRTSAVAAPPATTTAHSGARKHDGDDARCDAGEPRVEHERAAARERLGDDERSEDRGRDQLEQLGDARRQPPAARRRPGRRT